MDLTQTKDAVGLALAFIALIGAALGWLRWVRPRWRKGRATLVSATDALLGRDAIIDSITGELISPALPGVGARMAHQEQQMELLTVTVTKLVDQQVHQQRLEARVDTHDTQIKELQEQVIERIAGKAESVAAWRAVEAVAKQADIGPQIEEKP